LGQPKEIKPTVGDVGGESLVTVPLYRDGKIAGLRLDVSLVPKSEGPGAPAYCTPHPYSAKKFLIFNEMRDRFCCKFLLTKKLFADS
jgi:hypothetical protein